MPFLPSPLPLKEMRQTPWCDKAVTPHVQTATVWLPSLQHLFHPVSVFPVSKEWEPGMQCLAGDAEEREGSAPAAFFSLQHSLPYCSQPHVPPYAREDMYVQCSCICWCKHAEQDLAQFAWQPQQLDTPRVSLQTITSASAPSSQDNLLLHVITAGLEAHMQ